MTRATRYLLLTLTVTFSVAVFVYVVVPQCAVHPCAGNGQSITLVNDEVAPFRYRILNRLLPALIYPAPVGNETLVAALLLHTVCFAAVYSGLYVWLKRWGSDDRAMMGVFMFAAFLPLAMHIYAPLVASILEVALVTWSLVFSNRFRVVVVLLIIAAFNRETAVLIPLAYLALNPRKWQRGAILIGIYAAITAGLHIWLGSAPHQLGLMGTFQYNRDTFSNAFFVNLMTFPLWLAVIAGYRKAPANLKRLCWVAVLYGVSILILASWEEARLQMVLFPLVLPVIVSKCRELKSLTVT